MFPDLDERRWAYFDYCTMLDEYREAFPAARIVAVPFERGSLAEGDVVRDALGRAGVPCDADDPLPREDNAALSAEAGLFAERLNAMLPRRVGGAPNPRRDPVVERALADFSGSAPRIDRAAASAFQARFAASNAALRERWVPDLPPSFDALAGSGQTPEPDEAALMEVAAAVIGRLSAEPAPPAWARRVRARGR
ncbi:hypothetical protein [Demequina litorisediminis]|uniref:Uncharacterized protein n=1 Tax=Demequina litorisediminis TaxID=1849022 RepID=A0ABQ6IFA4_9MICO|nr:hypothetical protein [Demequina litorisediminis]GMA35851.1 hypothetical protein GCM10025876_20550 [Demequina litorisediminis]